MRHSRLLPSVVAASLTVGLGTAIAVSEASTSAPVPTSSTRAAAEVSLAADGVAAQGRSVTAVSVTAPVPAAASSSGGQSPLDQQPAQPDRADKDIERLRLHCEGMATDTTSPVIACRWSESEAPRFAGYRLLRGDGDHRSIVFQTRDRSEMSFVDRKVRAGATYEYVVQVLGPQGQVIGMSEPSTVDWPSSDPSVADVASW